ncbi:MAG: sigma-54-dependent Fis family transcriptional regulator [Deltaproteobacteria bacterium HGW-Deltaproteobacteria-6]|nr:MAG: sigma-54-dependent Fis family transcriptional regulator [Deltaproteobacteria bacterium HGW-Deltaproteobacteria-6]
MQIKKYFTDNSPIHVSLLVMVPSIFTGIAILTFIVAHYTSNASIEKLLLIGSAVIVFTAVSAIIVTFAILRPVRKFIKAAEGYPVFPKAAESESRARKRDDISHFDYVFREITNILSKVDARERFPDIVGQSRGIRGVLGQVVKVAMTDTTVLILGESGVGKELIADAIFKESNRRGKAFIKLNCVAIPTGLLESELFGHEKGAFTGAVVRKTGKFELANGGTLFLDEIGDMPLETQAKLLRVLQEREFQRVGGTQTIKVDVHFIAASNKNLRRMVDSGSFREDLFYRLNVFPIYIPPLRERFEDIPLLVRHILDHMPGVPEITVEAMRELMTWHWPGNVRELKNVIERAAVMAENGQIKSVGLTGMKQALPEQKNPFPFISSLPPEKESKEISDSNEGPQLEEGFSLDDQLAAHEKRMIIHALNQAGGIQSRAACLLGINQRSLWHRIKKYEINVTVIKNHKQER